MNMLIFGLIGFHGLHSLRMIAPQFREKMVQKFGENAWKGLYSIATLGFLVLIIVGYDAARSEVTQLWLVPEWGKHVTFILMLLSFILIPFNMRSSRFRFITNHPFLLAIVLWSSAHLLVRSDGASVLLFGSFLVWSLVNWSALRKRNSAIPPVASLKIDIIAIIGGVAAWVVFILFAHEWLFGISPIG